MLTSIFNYNGYYDNTNLKETLYYNIYQMRINDNLAKTIVKEHSNEVIVKKIETIKLIYGQLRYKRNIRNII